MTPLAPLFLWFLPLAALPLLFHLFFRTRRRRRIFPSLLFFLAADPRVHYRRKLREWLLLLLRTLVLLFLIMGLSRPVFQGSGGKPRKMAVIVDNSASMRAVDSQGRSRLSRALEVAAALIEAGGAALTLVVPTVTDARAVLPDAFAADAAPVRAALETILTTSAAGRPFEAVQRALVAGAALPGLTEIHVVTDGEGPEWGSETADSVPQSVRVFIHGLGRRGDHAAPLMLRRIVPLATTLSADRVWFVDVELANRGRSAAVATVVCRAGDGVWRESLSVSSESVQSLRAVMPGLPAGRHTVSVEVQGAVAAGFDTGFFEVVVVSPRPVLLLGAPGSAGVLAAALDPVGDGRLSGYRVHTAATVAEAERLVRVDEDMALVGASFVVVGQYGDWLQAAAERGVSVVLYPEAGDTSAVTLPAWCGATAAGAAASLAADVSLAVAWEDPLWQPLGGLAGSVQATAPITVLRAVTLVPTTGTRVAATAGNVPVLTVCNYGRGRVIVSGLAWDPAWSAWPQRAVFVPMLLALPAPPEAQSSLALVAGERLALPLAAQPAVGVRREDGTVLWQGNADQVQTVPAVPGCYTVHQETNQWFLGVVGDTSDAAGVGSGAVAALESPAWAPQAIVLTPSDAADALHGVERARRGVDLAGWFLAAAVLCQAAELAVAHHRVFRHG